MTTEHRSRMTIGGKLSFRGRTQRLRPADGNLPLVDQGDNPPPLDELVPAGHDNIEIEVGSGKGAFLVAATAARPDSFWVGIEASISYAELAANRLAAEGRSNGVLLVDNAALFLRDRCEPGSVARLHVYYPDPWPKRRHRGRRFFAAASPATLRRVLRDDGVLFVATDNAAYAGQIARTIGASSEFVRDRELEDELRDQPGCAFSPTNFERKYIEQARILRKFAWRVSPR